MQEFIVYQPGPHELIKAIPLASFASTHGSSIQAEIERQERADEKGINIMWVRVKADHPMDAILEAVVGKGYRYISHEELEELAPLARVVMKIPSARNIRRAFGLT